MTSQQVDRVKALIADCDDFAHAFIQDHPAKTAEVLNFGAALAEWADSNPVPELKP